MKKTKLICAILFIIAIATACSSTDNNTIDDNTIEGQINKTFSVWAKNNLNSKYKILLISYDMAGTPFDYIWTGSIMNESVGASGKTKHDVETGASLIMLESIIDSTYINTPLSVANIYIDINNNTICYYMGLRGDSICTVPLLHGYDALKMIHNNGEQIIYDACHEITINCYVYAKSLGATLNNNTNFDEEQYDFWIKRPKYEETTRATESR